MKKQYSVPTLTNHGSVQAITEWLGNTDKNDFLFFNGSSTPINNGGSPGTGDGSVDGVITPGGIVPRGTLQGK